MTPEDWMNIIPGGIIIGYYDKKPYKTEDLLNKNDFKFLTWENNSTEISTLQYGTEIMILNPSGEIIVGSNRDEAENRAKEGALLIIPDSNDMEGAIGIPFEVMLNSAFRAWEKDPKTPIHIKFGEFDTDRSAGNMKIIFETIPMTADNKCPVLDGMPKYFVAYKAEGPGDRVTIINPDNWINELISKGYVMIGVYPNQESMDWAYPP